MMPRIAIYTCVTAGYDVVLPPVEKTPGADHLLFTDDPGLRVRGWRSRPLARASAGLPSNLQNRFHKLLPHKVLGPDYDLSIYVDGNIRLRRDLSPLVDRIDGYDIGLFPHELRRCVEDEVEACVARGKVRDPGPIRVEYTTYKADGFTDAPGCLSENAVLFRRHGAQPVRDAMELWWDLVTRHSGRDQISLPYVVWRTGLPVYRFDFSYRLTNPWFYVYKHRKDQSRRSWLRVYTHGRRLDGLPFRLLNRIARNL